MEETYSNNITGQNHRTHAVWEAKFVGQSPAGLRTVPYGSKFWTQNQPPEYKTWWENTIIMISIATSQNPTWSWHLVFPSVGGDNSKLPGKLPERMRIFRHKVLRPLQLSSECRWSDQGSAGSRDRSQSPREHQRSDQTERTTSRTGPGNITISSV